MHMGMMHAGVTIGTGLTGELDAFVAANMMDAMSEMLQR